MLDSRGDFEKLYDGAPDPLYVHDLNWRLVRVNRAFEQVSGYTRADAAGMSFLDLLVPEHRETFIQQMAEQMGGSPPRPLEIDLLARGGSRVTLQVKTELFFQDGRLAGVQGIARDIAVQRREFEALAAAAVELTEKMVELASVNRRLRALYCLSTAHHADVMALFASYLKTGCEMLGLPHAAIWQMTPDGMAVRAALGEGAAGEDPAEQIAVTDRSTVIVDGGDPRCKCSLYAGTQLFFDDKAFGRIAFWSNAPGKLHANAREIIQMIAQGISAALQRIRTGEQAVPATQDPLTKVSNRLVLSRRLESALASARDSGSMVAIFFIDLDRFKRVNHTFGRAAGDAFLQQVGARLQAHMRMGDTLARMGGDEFTAILPGTGEQAQVRAVAQRLLEAIRTPCRIGQSEMSVSASIGMSVYPRDGVDAGALLRNALAAMFAAERRGSDGAQLYSAEDTKSAVARLSITTSLRRALERNEFRLFFQPQVDLHGRLAGAEVLLGWLHPDLGRVPAHEFIPIAEETGMILPIGNWVLREACRQSAEWLQKGGARVTIAVNVSAAQFAHAGFADSVASVLKETGLPAELLELELTESLLVRDVEQVAASLGKLRALGVRIAIDDFGTGYSSLRYIRHLPLDTLKIDRSFVIGSENDDASIKLLRAIVALGHTLGLTVTAEGVETCSHLHLVRTAGCDLAQGHLFGAALDARGMAALLGKAQPVFAAAMEPRKARPRKTTRALSRSDRGA
jgi:diguanylate cyclase (GGDEF)-like protein/PAS domain S-box-containing protein